MAEASPAKVCRMEDAVTFSPCISSFCRGVRAMGMAIQRMMYRTTNMTNIEPKKAEASPVGKMTSSIGRKNASLIHTGSVRK